jgi:hypothetical protein
MPVRVGVRQGRVAGRQCRVRQDRQGRLGTVHLSRAAHDHARRYGSTHQPAGGRAARLLPAQGYAGPQSKAKQPLVSVTIPFFDMLLFPGQAVVLVDMVNVVVSLVS